MARRCWAPFLRKIAVGNSQTHQYPGPLVVRRTHNRGLFIFGEKSKPKLIRELSRRLAAGLEQRDYFGLMEGLEYNGRAPMGKTQRQLSRWSRALFHVNRAERRE